MAEPQPHTDAYMAMDDRRRMWRGFGRAFMFFFLHAVVIVAYLTFVLAMHADWFASLVIIALFALLAGWILQLGRLWTAFVLASAVAVIVIRLFVAVGSGVFGAY